ncbi:hypothetical protein EDD15DRAFT_2449545 [Pisolithus albus]|nr:hypothetical protein EDD15DRAFT_2449545 [Pisolithus albus]
MTLQYKITHVFCPLQLPDGDDHCHTNDLALSEAVCKSAVDYSKYLGDSAKADWECIRKLLQNLCDATSSHHMKENCVELQLKSMAAGDVVAYLIRAQNAAVVFRRGAEDTIAESFEVSPTTEAVMGSCGKLVCSYPGPAIAVPNEVFDDSVFRLELAHFLCEMNKDILDAVPTSCKAGSTVSEERDTAHPRYITELLTGILRAVGRPAEVQRINKRIGDDVVWRDARLPWRRSSFWLLVRVVLQTTLARNGLGIDGYKIFMLFFMNGLAGEAKDSGMPDDILHWVSAKISRRLTKLGGSAPDWLSDSVLQTCTGIRSLLDSRWEEVRKLDAFSSTWNPFSLNFLPDTSLSLVDSHEYISNVLNSNYAVLQPADPVTDGRLRGDLDHFLSMTSDFFQVAYEADPRVTLYDVERGVSYGIDDWVAAVSAVDEIAAACERLELLASRYSVAARDTYEGNPEDFSRMLLTVIELWVAIDKLVIRQIPMLGDYSPEVPTTLLERLLLRDAHDIHRLSIVYDYIRKRHSRSRNEWSVFSDSASSNNFAVRYFNQDPHLQALRDRIVNAADQERREKVEELKRSNELYYDLSRRVEKMDHDYWITRWGRQRCQSDCKKCSLERQSKIEIAVHEWPLPEDTPRVQIAVFELKRPLAFDMWRSATCLLLVDICSPPPEPKYPYTSLEGYPVLYSYGTEHARTRVTLASDKKPFIYSHYRSASVPTEESRVCTNNGLSFYYYDKCSKVSLAEAFSAVDISGRCSHQLPRGPYQNLQCYLQHTAHTSNEVLCRQADCDKDLSIHEFIAYGHLRSSPLLQWLNILREIRANTLTLRRDEVHILFAQAASQVGPVSDDGKLVWHLELEQPNFRLSLLGELETLVSSVSGNWLEGATMVTISFLVARILAVAFAVQDDSFRRALMLLRTVREKTFCWVLELFHKLEQTTCEVEKEQLRGRLRDSAAICRSTFDVGRGIATHVLDSPQALEILICCAIIINNNKPPQFDSLGGVSRLLMERDRRLSWDLEELVGTMIVQGNEGVDLGIKRVWPGYRRDTQCTRWQRASLGNCSWFTTNTSSSDTQCSQWVHFDALDGTILVDGRPMGRLPNAIRTDPIFTSLFGDQAPDVLPGDMVGMEYVTRGFIEDYRVYFRTGTDGLVVRAKKADSDVFELIPPGKLSSDLPAPLVENHVHWLNLTTQVLEARPVENIWKSSADNWTLHFSPGSHSMIKGDTRLFDVRSQTWRMLSERLQPLEKSRNLVILLENARTVSASLPRYGLSFFINDDQELECRHPRGMVYDECQSAGTLIGLANKLVLRPKANLADEGAQRLVLVPEADVSCRRQDNHVRVTIDTSGPARRRFRYQTFRIDTDFGCLAGNATLASNLYRAYLHALTSKPCLVDPLTRRTGTEEALSILHSAACHSFMKIDSRSAELLCCIAKLTTPRTWYPRHMRCMQTVHWPAELPVGSQHHDFYVACLSIKNIQQQLHILHDGQSTPAFTDFPPCDEHLLRRAAIRAAVLYQPTYANPCPGGGSDSVYEARDVQQSSADELRVFSTALAVYNWSTQKRPADNIRSLIQLWDGTLLGVSHASRLRYSREWLSPNLRAVWLSLYDGCRRSGPQHRFQLIFSLPAMAYASPQLEDVVNTLLAFATMPQFEHENPPDYPDYNLSDGYEPSRHALDQRVSWREKDSVSRQEYKEQLQQEKGEIIAKAIDAWRRTKHPPSRNFFRSNWHDIDALHVDFRELFTSCYRNMELKAHFERVESILQSFHEVTPSPGDRPLGYSFAPFNQGYHRRNWNVTLEVLFHRPAPAVLLKGVTTEDLRIKLPCDYALNHLIGSPSTSSTGQMSQLIGDLHRNANSAFGDMYANMLEESASHLSCDQTTLKVDALANLVGLFRTHYRQSRRRYRSALRFLSGYLGPQTISERAVNRSGRWPRITAKVLFGCLASTSRILLPDDWRVCLIAFAKLALEYQRARRMLALAKNSQAEDLQKELENTGCDGWEAGLYVDRLLIQLDGDFLVRRVQADVALEMIAPRSGRNTVLQLNMGEGKSSVIVPAIASVLADGNQLVRVVVPKALASQMFHLLVHRLGGLVNRRVFYLPFSRSLQIGRSEAKAIQEILKQCVRDRGILVVQPEHILSFKLLSVEKQLGDTTDVDKELLQTQRWLHSYARDILDESDEILHVRNQLIYAVGSQRPLEGSPTRWSTTQQLLHLVKKHAPTLNAEFPLGVEYEQRHGSRAFPHIRILHRDAGDELISRTAQDVMDGRLLNFGGTRGIEKTAIHHFITRMDVASSEVQMIRDYCGDTAMWMTLLHLRGLLASGILLFALMERRWRVGYGLAPSRTMLAVPYRAKDVPAPRAEFGHPDVAILLTCLSYYYGGLTREQLGLCFERLLMLDNPDQEYESWVRNCLEVPEHLRQISGINTQSVDQWNLHLVPLFSHNQSTIDFYLSQVVFPKEAKEFPSRLSSCGWDLAEEREHVTTGFSGTNDTRYLLPTSITQRDLDHQRSTNAKVLTYLLRPENDVYVQTSWPCGRRRTTTEFLTLVAEQKPEIRVILDVGAQVLELQNNELAARWLELKSDALAAIYFNDKDELIVRSREGTIQSFLDSSYAGRLDECVIYLDDAHTRGTDIKFPIGFRAAVTLGPKVTKDRLTQGCMRMRRLGHGHSVMFFSPLEVDRSIRDAARKSGGDVIHPSDILLWAMGETCIEIENSAPYWSQQGKDHSLRHSAWWKFCNGEITPQELATTWCQPDAKTLEELYAPCNPGERPLLSIPAIDQRCRELGVSSSTNLNMNEEQEREIVHEIERETQVERPPPAIPAVHRVSVEVRHFVRTGVVAPSPRKAFILMFDSFRNATPFAQEESAWSQHIFATSDYCTVVQGRAGTNVGEYLRPANWILSSQSSGSTILVILSPFEVNELLPEIRSSSFVRLHIYTPRTQARMLSCDDLSLYTIPSAPSYPIPPASLVDQINLFAGQLYLRDYTTYLRLCRFLCVYADDLAGEGDLEVESDGFIAPAHRPLAARPIDSFQQSPLPFLKHVINLRRRGMNFVATHMGKILDGRLLKAEDFADQQGN